MQQSTTTSAHQADASAADVAALTQFEGPPEQFVQALLNVQRRVARAPAAAWLRLGADGEAQVLAAQPALDRDRPTPAWLARAVEAAPQCRDANVRRIAVTGANQLYGTAPQQHVLLVPVAGDRGLRGLAAVVVDESDEAALQRIAEKLELTIPLLSLYETRLTLAQRRDDVQRLTNACQVLAELNAQHRYQAAAMALCNQLASIVHADRVSFGLLHGRYVKLHAMSHTENFTRKMELVQAIEATMEEAVDQDIEVLHPGADDEPTVDRAATDLSRRFGPLTTLTLPMRRDGKCVGAVTLERSAEQPFELAEVEALRLTLDLCTARLVDLRESDRWFGAKLLAAGRRGGAAVVGPEHTWVKVAAIAVTAVLAFAIFGHGTYRVEAPFTVEPAVRQVVAAPFDAYLLDVEVEVGDVVTAGETVLATLDTAALRLQLADAIAERATALRRAQIARRDDEIADAQIAEAEAEQLTARIDLLQYRIDQATLHAPIDGVVITGDLRQQLGAPVEAGQRLFEIAPLEAMEAHLSVPEHRIADVARGQVGELAAAADPGQRVAFEVVHIDPVAQVKQQQNVFRVRADVEQYPAWLRPNVEGVAKIDIDQRRYITIYTQDLVNWVRMKLWW